MTRVCVESPVSWGVDRCFWCPGKYRGLNPDWAAPTP